MGARHRLPASRDAAPILPAPTFDRIADMTRRILGVPTAAVTLVEHDRQSFIGAVGLAEPWKSLRETPLSHSLCKHVVSDSAPLVVGDTRLDERLVGNHAIDELGVIAYAGMPLTNVDGDVIGSLCATDTVPRDWTQAQLANLRDLAAACSSTLQLHEVVEESFVPSEHVHSLIESMPVGYVAYDGDWRVTSVNAEAARIVDLAVGDQIGHILWELFPAAVGTDLDVAFRRVRDTGETEVFEFFYPDPLNRWYEIRVQSAPPGLSVFFTDVSERHRVQGLLADAAEHDRSTAQTLQRALLTPLPAVPGVHLAARYLPAESTDHVGGDWYDAVVQPRGALTVSVGDVSGHGIEAAAAMGQFRTMLRALVWDNRDSVARSVTRLDSAALGHGVVPAATLISGRITGLAGSQAQFVWSNAGHPPPLLLLADGSVRRLEAESDLMLGVKPNVARSDHSCDLPPGSTLILYTDGLVENASQPFDRGIDRLSQALTDHHTDALDVLLDRTLEDLREECQSDDIALLAVQVDARAPDGVVEVSRSCVLAADDSAAATSRSIVRDVAAGLSADLVHRAVLLTSEVVTNALRHGEPEISLQVDRDGSGLRVSVHDHGPIVPVFTGLPSPLATGGRGLAIVDAMAGAWGIDSDARPTGTTIWFRLDEVELGHVR